MPRRKSVNLVRNVGKDPRFGSELMQKFINMVLRRGKKHVAQKIVYDAMDFLAEKFGGEDKAYEVFEKAISNLKPAVEVKARRVGGSVYQVPIEVRPLRARTLALRWLIAAAKKRKDKTMGIRLAKELIDAYEQRGGAYKKRVDVHKMAEANRAFSHYAW